jgi:hypothetical protein
MKTLLTLILIFVCSLAFGQVKIGNITIADSTAQKYFLDCYQHTDTIKLKDEMQDVPVVGRTENSISYMPMSFEQEMEYKAPVIEFNNNVIKNSIGKAYKSVFYPAEIDTLWNEYWSASNGKSGHSKEYSKIENVPARTEQEFIGYLVPRKPSEIDFIKWEVKQHNK